MNNLLPFIELRFFYIGTLKAIMFTLGLVELHKHNLLSPEYNVSQSLFLPFVNNRDLNSYSKFDYV